MARIHLWRKVIYLLRHISFCWRSGARNPCASFDHNALRYHLSSCTRFRGGELDRSRASFIFLETDRADDSRRLLWLVLFAAVSSSSGSSPDSSSFLSAASASFSCHKHQIVLFALMRSRKTYFSPTKILFDNGSSHRFTFHRAPAPAVLVKGINLLVCGRGREGWCGVTEHVLDVVDAPFHFTLLSLLLVLCLFLCSLLLLCASCQHFSVRTGIQNNTSS